MREAYRQHKAVDRDMLKMKKKKIKGKSNVDIGGGLPSSLGEI